MKFQANPTAGPVRGWKGMVYSPLSTQLLQEELPTHCVPSKFNLYDGTRDPTEHIYHFHQPMALVDDHKGLLCQVFSASLQGHR